MTPGRIEAIIERVEAAQNIGTRDIDRFESGKHNTVSSYDFGIVSADDNGACWMYEDDYMFILHAPNDIRDLVEALERAQALSTPGGQLAYLEDLEKQNKVLKDRVSKAVNERDSFQKEFSLTAAELLDSKTEIIRLATILSDLQQGFKDLEEDSQCLPQ